MTEGSKIIPVVKCIPYQSCYLLYTSLCHHHQGPIDQTQSLRMYNTFAPWVCKETYAPIITDSKTPSSTSQKKQRHRNRLRPNTDLNHPITPTHLSKGTPFTSPPPDNPPPTSSSPPYPQSSSPSTSTPLYPPYPSSPHQQKQTPAPTTASPTTGPQSVLLKDPWCRAAAP